MALANLAKHTYELERISPQSQLSSTTSIKVVDLTLRPVSTTKFTYVDGSGIDWQRPIVPRPPRISKLYVTKEAHAAITTTFGDKILRDIKRLVIEGITMSAIALSVVFLFSLFSALSSGQPDGIASNFLKFVMFLVLSLAAIRTRNAIKNVI